MGFFCWWAVYYHFACWKPERVITYVAIKGGYYFAEPDNEALKIPALWFTGQYDKKRRIDVVNKLLNDHIKDKPLWCLANEAASGHEIGQTDELVFPWLKEIIKQRLPEKSNPSNQPLLDIDTDKAIAWLGDRTDGYIAPLSDYEKDRNNSSWLPNEDLANVWKEFHLHK